VALRPIAPTLASVALSLSLSHFIRLVLNQHVCRRHVTNSLVSYIESLMRSSMVQNVRHCTTPKCRRLHHQILMLPSLALLARSTAKASLSLSGYASQSLHSLYHYGSSFDGIRTDAFLPTTTGSPGHGYVPSPWLYCRPSRWILCGI
jgi:hypothetical protein